MQLRQKHGEFQAKNAAILAVSFESRQRNFQLSRQLQLPFPILSDPERDIYRAYGLQQGYLRQVFSLGTILAYVKLLAQGHLYHFRKSDLRQLGGDFVIDTVGMVRYQYRSAAPHDRPSGAELVRAVDAM